MKNCSKNHRHLEHANPPFEGQILATQSVSGGFNQIRESGKYSRESQRRRHFPTIRSVRRGRTNERVHLSAAGRGGGGGDFEIWEFRPFVTSLKTTREGPNQSLKTTREAASGHEKMSWQRYHRNVGHCGRRVWRSKHTKRSPCLLRLHAPNMYTYLLNCLSDCNHTIAVDIVPSLSHICIILLICVNSNLKYAA